MGLFSSNHEPEHEPEPLFPDVTDGNGISFTDPFYDPWDAPGR